MLAPTGDVADANTTGDLLPVPTATAVTNN